MRLYLVQHGEAVPESEDPRRPLTEAGRRDAERVARLVVGRTGVRVGRIVHSGKLRAAQTAQVWASLLPGVPVEERDGLAPQDDPRVWADRVRAAEEDLLVVGHLPHLRRLASLLLCGSAEGEAVAFAMGGIVGLERDDRTGRWTLRWAVPPELAPEPLGDPAGPPHGAG
jgi:phosphohistidine phosphatase